MSFMDKLKNVGPIIDLCGALEKMFLKSTFCC